MVEPKEIIRLARKHKGLNQKEFSQLINKSQAVVSKYETGQIIPPGNILLRCQKILNKTDTQSDMESMDYDVEDLVRMLRSKAVGKQQAKLRQTIRQIIEIATVNS